MPDEWTKYGISIQWDIIHPQITNEVVIYATVWMILENIMLCKRSQTKGCILFHLYVISTIGKYIETKNKLVIARVWEEGRMAITTLLA